MMQARVALVASAVLVLAACGNQSEPATTSTAPVVETAATVTTTTASPEQTSTTTTPTTTTSTTVPLAALVVTSPSYGDGEPIPLMFTCDGDNVSPEYSVDALPAGTVSMVIVMDDPVTPVGVWDHWVEFDIPTVETIPEGATELGTKGTNSWSVLGYLGPCPPPGALHTYTLAVYALDATLDLDEGAGKHDVLTAMDGHVLAVGELLGTFTR